MTRTAEDAGIAVGSYWFWRIGMCVERRGNGWFCGGRW